MYILRVTQCVRVGRENTEEDVGEKKEKQEWKMGSDEKSKHSRNQTTIFVCLPRSNENFNFSTRK